MASKALPQALLTIARNPNQSSQKKLGFATVSLRSFSFHATLVSNSMVPVTSGASKLNRIGSGRDKRSFIVRSEADSEAEVVESVENVEEIEAVDASEVIDVEVDSVDGGEVTDGEAEVQKPPRQPRIKLGEIMGILNKRAVEASEKERPIPDIRTGDVVEIKLEVPENRRRASIYKGIVISRQNAGIHTTIRVRRIIAGVGVEIVFPLYSPNIKELKVVKHRKVRRARLYYLRDKLPRLSTFK